MLTVSSRQFNNDVAGAKRAASHEPVFITDRGEPSYVLLSVAKFRELTRTGKSGLDVVKEIGALFNEGELDFDWEPGSVTGYPKAAECDDD